MRPASSSRVMSETDDIKRGFEQPEGRGSSTQDMTKVQRAHLEHIAQTELALIGEPVSQHERENSKQDQRQEHCEAAVPSESCRKDETAGNREAVTDNQWLRLLDSKHEETEKKREETAALADVKYLEGINEVEDGDVGVEAIMTSKGCLRVL